MASGAGKDSPLQRNQLNFIQIPVSLTLALLAPISFAQDDQELDTRPDQPLITITTSGNSMAATAGTGLVLNIVYSNTAGAPANMVPSLGVGFDAGGGSGAAFRRPVLSRNGTHWAIEADTDQATTMDNIYIVNGNLFLQEGTQPSWAPVGELVGTLDDNIAINNLGEVLITNNLGGTAAGTADDVVVFFDSAGTPTVLAREGDLVDPILPALAGATWDDSMDSAVLLDITGAAGWAADGLDGTSGGTADDDVCLLNGVVVAQRGVTVPAGQAGGTTDRWENFDLDDFYVNTDGTQILIQGDTDGATTDDDVLVLNGTVVLQENQVVPGGPFVDPIDTSGIVKSWMDNAGNWFARGNNLTTEQDWVVRNGTVIAFSDGLDEIVPGSLEHWDDTDFSDCFFAMDGNASGAYIIGGLTDAPSASNGVLVFDDGAGNRMVLCREGDPVDANENGILDDDRFINSFGNDDALLTDDGRIVFVATLRNGAGTPIDEGLFLLEADTGQFGDLCNGDGGDQMGCTDCPCGNNASLGTIGGCLNSVSTSARLTATGDTSVTLPSGSMIDLRLGISGAPPTAFCILNSGDNVAPQGMANPCFGLDSGAQSATFDGLRCAVQNTLRHGGRSADSNGDVGVTNNPWGGEGGPPIGIATAAGFAAGQTRYFQVIHRDDPLAVCGRGLNTSQAVQVTFEP